MSRGPADTTDDVPVPATAARLRALLHQSPDTALSPAEAALLTQWLDQLANGPQRDR
ncbi:hypothetical protein ACFU99_04145 [Streptomyces sp. NPDC057654]|uniref:hypothetical protein n=1 Tax=Streptomyces sp. NPDC057654 TaxID=3346196 RepID=UPI003685F932